MLWVCRVLLAQLGWIAFSCSESGVAWVTHTHTQVARVGHSVGFGVLAKFTA